MTPTIDRMLELTAEIADELLKIKDAGSDALPAELKLNIISLAEIASGTPDAAPEPEPVREPEPMEKPVPEPEPSAEEEVEEEMSDAEEEAGELETSVNDEVAMDSEAEIAADEAEVAIAETAASAEFEEEADAEITPEPEPETTKEPEPAKESEPEPEPEPQPEPEPVKETAKREFRIAPAALRQAFSINDAFLFRREIFGGSKESFDEALAHMANLTSRRALQEYLVEELGLNLNESPGREFYDTLEVFF